MSIPEPHVAFAYEFRSRASVLASLRPSAEKPPRGAWVPQSSQESGPDSVRGGTPSGAAPGAPSLPRRPFPGTHTSAGLFLPVWPLLASRFHTVELKMNVHSDDVRFGTVSVYRAKFTSFASQSRYLHSRRSRSQRPSRAFPGPSSPARKRPVRPRGVLGAPRQQLCGRTLSCSWGAGPRP